MSDSPASILFDHHGTDITTVSGVDGVRLGVQEQAVGIAQNDIVGADNYRESIPGGTNYGLAIDLDNPGGVYKHGAGSGLVLYSVSSTLVKESVGANWNAVAGVILTINGTSADIAWLEFLSLHAEDSSTNIATRVREAYPIPMDLTVVAGALPKLATGYVETITAINTGITLDDISGVPRTPAVGDLVSRVTRESGSGNAKLHASLWYTVV